jgi:hypothetical protein
VARAAAVEVLKLEIPIACAKVSRFLGRTTSMPSNARSTLGQLVEQSDSVTEQHHGEMNPPVINQPLQIGSLPRGRRPRQDRLTSEQINVVTFQY